MSELILLYAQDAPWTWGLTASGNSGVAVTDEEKSALVALSFSKLIVVLPGQYVVSKLHTLENLNEKQQRAAAGFSIEDELAQSLDECHIALAQTGSRLAVVSVSVMDDIIASLRKSGLNADIICADYEAISGEDSFIFEDRIVRRANNTVGFAADTNLASLVLDAGQTLPPSIHAPEFLHKIAESLAGGHEPLNLRQGIYADAHIKGFAHFKRALLIAAGIVILFVGANIGLGMRLANQTKALNAEIAHLYQEIYPGAEVPKNPAKVVQKNSQDGQTNTSQEFTQLSALLASSVKQVTGTEVASLRYDASRRQGGSGQLTLSITYSSFDDVEKLKTAVNKFGGAFVENGTRKNGDKLRGDAVLRLKP